MNDDIDSKVLRLESELDAARTRITQLEAEKAEARHSYEEHVAQLSVGRVVFRKALESIVKLTGQLNEWRSSESLMKLIAEAAQKAIDSLPAATEDATKNYEELVRLRAEALASPLVLHDDGQWWVSTTYEESEVWGRGASRQAAIDDLCQGVLDTHSFAHDDTAVADWSRMNTDDPRLTAANVEIEALRDENATLIGERALSPTKTEHYERVELFHAMMHQPGPAKPEVPDDVVRRRRANLVLEEALELIEAMGFAFNVCDASGLSASDTYLNISLCQSSAPITLAHIAKELGDLSVVMAGSFIACGIHDRPVLEAVDKSNLDKLGPGHSFREDGKLLKPPGHQPPDMAAVLRAQGWQG